MQIENALDELVTIEEKLQRFENKTTSSTVSTTVITTNGSDFQSTFSHFEKISSNNDQQQQHPPPRFNLNRNAKYSDVVVIPQQEPSVDINNDDSFDLVKISIVNRTASHRSRSHHSGPEHEQHTGRAE